MTNSNFPAFKDYKVINGIPSQAYQMGKPPKELVFLGFRHSNNPDDPTYEIMRQEFAKFKPQIVLFESYDWPIEGDPISLIRHYGESAYLCRLAHDAGVPYESAEPGRDVETRQYIAKYGDQLIPAFYVFRQVWQYHRQEIKAKTFDAEVRKYLELSFTKLALNFKWADLNEISLRELNIPFKPDDDKTMRRYRQATDPTQTGSIFNEIALYTGYVRDKSVVEKIARFQKEYDRIMIVMGSSHYYTIEPYLRKLYP